MPGHYAAAPAAYVLVQLGLDPDVVTPDRACTAADRRRRTKPKYHAKPSLVDSLAECSSL
jgi:hypothetical protein